MKEGLTVFRDQSFSGDMRGEAVQRIKDVKALRARQFSEDAGPLAHPVRPSSYLKIDNFYTATIYEKGSEVIRMLKTLLGADVFRQGMDLYFTRHDGEATTVEAYIQCFADVSGRDLTDFFRSGPGQHLLCCRCLPAPAMPSIGLLHDDGRPMGEECLVILDQDEQTITLPAPARPVISPLRGFSAPVNLTTDSPEKDRYVLLAADTDLFNRWEAGQDLAKDLILKRAKGAPDEVAEERFAHAMGRSLGDQAADPAFKALLLALPTEGDLSLAMTPADPKAIHDARDHLRARLAVHLGDDLRRLHAGLSDNGPFSPDAEAAGRRALRNAALDLLSVDHHAENADIAARHFDTAANMTDAIGGLAALMALGGEAREKALEAFHARWKDEPLVLDKWFAIQARESSEEALGRVLGLTVHPDFDRRNPNRLRALVGTFAGFNPARFHDPSGAGYRFLADQIIATDAVNPMTAARFVEPLGGWRRYKPELGALMKAELERIVAVEGLSKNVFELASKALD